MKISIDQIYILRKPGVFCIKNELYKLAYISHSSCILKTLGTLFYKPKLMKEIGEIQDLHVELLHESNSKSTRLLHLSHYKHQLELDGYKLIEGSPDGTRYTLKIKVYKDFRRNRTGTLFHVELTSQKANRLVLGVFDTLQEAEAWCIAIYGSLAPKGVIPKFCTNELTMVYLVQVPKE